MVTVPDWLFAYFFGAMMVATFLLGGVALLKGKRALFVIGFVSFGVTWWFGGLRLARPRSVWGQRFYGVHRRTLAAARDTPEERARARRRALVSILAFFVLYVVGSAIAGAIGISTPDL